MRKKVRIFVTAAKAAQLRREARYQDILAFLLSERRRVDKQIANARRCLAKQRAVFEAEKREYVEQLERAKKARVSTTQT